MTFVPDDFDPPRGLASDAFELEPLGPEHNDADYEAWTSSMDHIRATRGFVGGKWPREMTREENRRDLERHANDFAARRGFTYTVREPGGGDVIGCVYIYPRKDEGGGAQLLTWVRASHAELDGPLRATVRDWLDSAWPFEDVES